MKTNDPDRCPAGHDLHRQGRRAVVQCQGSINHNGKHSFEEDHYVVRWDDPAVGPPREEVAVKQILVIDDNPTALDAVAETLRTTLRDAEINICISAQRAFEAISNFDYHLVIVDQCMPEMSGTELIKRMKAVRPKLSILLMSGYGSDGLGSNAIELGASGFLKKPVDGGALTSMVEQALERTSRDRDCVPG